MTGRLYGFLTALGNIILLDIATINEAHNIFLVQNQGSNEIRVNKMLDFYNVSVYEYLKTNYITGIPKLEEFYENDKLILIEEYIQSEDLESLISEISKTKEEP